MCRQLRRALAAGAPPAAVGMAGAVLWLGTAMGPAQPPAGHHWIRLTADTNEAVWMDTSHASTDSAGVALAWYKVQAPHAQTVTVVEYAVDCRHFQLASRHTITYDGTGAIVLDDRVRRPFHPPPFLPSVQHFMHAACHQPQPQ